jgi:hypothetical protein
MKKLLLSFLLALFACFSTFANDADLFNLDYNAVQSEFADLDQLSNMVAANSDLTYTSLKLSDENLITGLKLVSNVSAPFGTFGEPLLGIPSFLWGCVFGPIGMLVVYVGTDEDKEETKKALWGCVASTAAYGVFYIVWAVVWASAANAI